MEVLSELRCKDGRGKERRMTCLECEEYNHEEMYCPKFCDVIRTAVKDIQKDSIPILWIKEWIEEIKDHPAYTEKEKILCIVELEDMLGAWAEERKEE